MSFQGRLLSTSYTSHLLAINGVMSLALWPQVVSQTPQHFRPSVMHAVCESCFAQQSICSNIFHDLSMSTTVHPHESLKVDVNH